MPPQGELTEPKPHGRKLLRLLLRRRKGHKAAAAVRC